MTAEVKHEKTTTKNPSSNNTLAIVSMVLGIVSLTGPGLFLGIPAIILAIIALKKNPADRGMSITGLVTGAVSTLLSFLVIIFFIFMMIVSLPAATSPSYETPMRDWSYRL
jgi:hypothetical protein